MGHSRRRIGADGGARYTAYYDDIRGRRRSAGTFATRKGADKAWQAAETQVAEGRAGDPARGRQTFRHYVEHEWLPHHVMEASTREGYTYSIYAHLMDTFGPMKMIEILPSHVREWVTAMTAAGMTAATLRSNKAILSAIFTTALNDQVSTQHPCKGVKTPPGPEEASAIITPEEFDTFYAHLPDADAQLLVETAIESGMRWGELTELRPGDLDLPHHLVTVSRTVVQINDKFHPDGGNFLVKDYPKDREPRRFRLSTQISGRLREHIRTCAIGPGDLIFTYRPLPPAARQPLDRTTDLGLGLTEPNARGRRYRHGTLSAYSAGPCRCEHCRGAYADYRARRRAQGSDHPAAPDGPAARTVTSLIAGSATQCCAPHSRVPASTPTPLPSTPSRPSDDAPPQPDDRRHRHRDSGGHFVLCSVFGIDRTPNRRHDGTRGHH